MVLRGEEIRKPKGGLGVLLPGLGAVSTTFVAGVEAIKKGRAQPIGSLTQMDTIRLGRRTDGRVPAIKDLVGLASLESLQFGGWDIFDDDCYEAARKARVLNPWDLELVKDELLAIRPMSAVFDPRYVRRLNGPNVKQGASVMELAEMLRDDIRVFMQTRNLERAVMVWCASTEVHQQLSEVHQTLAAFEEGLRRSDPAIAPSMVYAYASIRERVPFANGSPNLCVDIPALSELARELQVPVAGKDLKTGQTLMKTIIAPGLKARLLGISGWFSTNILGNRDGEVLDDEGSFRTKEESKLSVLESLLQPELYPDLYGSLYHKVRINYYPPRGDNKEGWDNIDIVGWMGYPMQIKIDFLCRDSILAAPIVLDLVLLLDLAARANMCEVQEWLSFYFKSPMTREGVYPEHSLSIQKTKLKNTLRWLMREKLITHLGLDYYYSDDELF